MAARCLSTTIGAPSSRGARRRAQRSDPPIRLARVPNEWFAYRTVAALGARGDAMVVWSEVSNEQGERLYGCGSFCHDRVMAAVAGPDGDFARARQISPLGTQTGGTLAVAVSDRGRSGSLAWQESAAGVNPEGALTGRTGRRWSRRSLAL